MSGLTISWWAFACPLSCFILTCHIEYMNSSSSLPCSCHTRFCGRPWDCLFRWAQMSEKMMKEATFECLGFQLLAMSCNLYVNIFGPQQISFSTAPFPPLALEKKHSLGSPYPIPTSSGPRCTKIAQNETKIRLHPQVAFDVFLGRTLIVGRWGQAQVRWLDPPYSHFSPLACLATIKKSGVPHSQEREAPFPEEGEGGQRRGQQVIPELTVRFL